MNVIPGPASCALRGQEKAIAVADESTRIGGAGERWRYGYKWKKKGREGRICGSYGIAEGIKAKAGYITPELHMSSWWRRDRVKTTGVGCAMSPTRFQNSEEGQWRMGDAGGGGA